MCVNLNQLSEALVQKTNLVFIHLPTRSPRNTEDLDSIPGTSIYITAKMKICYSGLLTFGSIPNGRIKNIGDINKLSSRGQSFRGISL